MLHVGPPHGKAVLKVQLITWVPNWFDLLECSKANLTHIQQLLVPPVGFWVRGSLSVPGRNVRPSQTLGTIVSSGSFTNQILSLLKMEDWCPFLSLTGSQRSMGPAFGLKRLVYFQFGIHANADSPDFPQTPAGGKNPFPDVM